MYLVAGRGEEDAKRAVALAIFGNNDVSRIEVALSPSLNERLKLIRIDLIRWIARFTDRFKAIVQVAAPSFVAKASK